MGKEARIGLLLGAAACLVAVMVDWVVEELREEDGTTGGQESLAESTPNSAVKQDSEPATEAAVTSSS
jgi:hypothetical protein